MKNKIEEELFKNMKSLNKKMKIPTDKKGKVLALRSLTADTKQIRGSKLGENMSEDADNESVGNDGYKRRFIEDDTLLGYKDKIISQNDQ